MTLLDSRGISQSLEAVAGSSYLSQSSALLSFGLGPDAVPRELRVRWPDGTTTIITEGIEGSAADPFVVTQPFASSNGDV